jgi:hypothetical protein
MQQTQLEPTRFTPASIFRVNVAVCDVILMSHRLDEIKAGKRNLLDWCFLTPSACGAVTDASLKRVKRARKPTATHCNGTFYD